jgi:hypothetical protein
LSLFSTGNRCIIGNINPHKRVITPCRRNILAYLLSILNHRIAPLTEVLRAKDYGATRRFSCGIRSRKAQRFAISQGGEVWTLKDIVSKSVRNA